MNEEKKNKMGFKGGVMVGVKGVKWAVQRPLFFLAGLGMLLTALCVTWLVPWSGAVMAGAVISGIACSGSAARGLASSGNKLDYPWRSWWEPWQEENRRLHIGRVIISGGVFFMTNSILKKLTLLKVGAVSASSEGVGGASQGVAVVLCYVMLVWLVASAGEVRGEQGGRDGWKRVVRIAGAPMALIGFGFFWLIFVMFMVFMVSVVAIGMSKLSGVGETLMLQAMVFLGATVLSAPLISMSAGWLSSELEGCDAEVKSSKEEGVEV